MTNYEWLVKNGKLAEFTFDIAYRGIRDITNLEMIAHKYNLPVDLAKTEGGQNSRAIANWLQEERKTKKYVECRKVADIISFASFKIPFDQKKFRREEVQQLFTYYRIDLLSAIGKLITKEIDE